MATLSTLQSDLATYRAARDKILNGQSYTIGSRQLRRPDLAEVEKRIEQLEYRIAMLDNNSGRIKSTNVIFGGVYGGS